MGASLTYQSKTTSSITVEAYHTETNGSRVYWYYKLDTSTSWTQYGSYDLLYSGEYKQKEFTGLSSGTTYDFMIEIVDGSDTNLPVLATAYESDITTNADGDTTPPTLTLERYESTKSSITLYASATDSESGVSGFYYYLNDAHQATVYGNPTNYTFSSLSSGTQYKVSVKAFDNDGNLSSEKYKYVTTASTLTNDMSEDFESSLKFKPSRGGYKEWYRTTSQRYGGSYSYRSGVISHSQNSWFEIESYFSNDSSVDFKYKISSESGYDYFKLYVNGSNVLSDSGLKDWQSFSYNLPSGTNKIKFEYVKDSSMSSNDDCVYIDDLNIIGLTAPDTPSHPPYVSDRLVGGFDLYWGDSSKAETYDLRYRLQNVTTWTDVTGINGTTYSLTGLDYGRGYQFEVRAVNSIGASSYTGTSSATTNPKPPQISEGGTTSSSISITVDQTMSGNWDDIVVRRYSSSSTFIDSKTMTKSDYDANNRTLTWSSLSSGIDYKFNAISRFTTGGGTTLSSVNSSNTLTLQASTRPNNWAWYTSKTSGAEFNLTDTEWNDFTSRINEFRTYKGYSTISFTQASSGNDLTATMFNEAKNAIGAMNATGITDRVKGDDVLASYFNTLRDKLNEL